MTTVTAEQVMKNYEHSGANEQDQCYDWSDIEDMMRDFAKFHVKAALKSCHEMCKSKFVAGETGYLKQEDVELAYPLSNIK